MKNQEIWKDILGFEDSYQISSFGNVRSVDRIVTNPIHGTIKLQGKIKKQHLSTKDNYYRVQLIKKMHRKTYLVHRLIANAFIENTFEPIITIKKIANLYIKSSLINIPPF